MFAAHKMLLGGETGVRVLDQTMNYETSANTATATMPAGGSTGNFLVVVLALTYGMAGLTAPSGWTKVLETNIYGTVYIFTRPWVAGATFSKSGLAGATGNAQTNVFLLDTPLVLGTIGSAITATSRTTLTMPSVDADAKGAWLLGILHGIHPTSQNIVLTTKGQTATPVALATAMRCTMGYQPTKGGEATGPVVATYPQVTSAGVVRAQLITFNTV